MIERSNLYRILALAGTLPFIGSVVLDVGRIDLLGEPARIASSYGLAIICFLCGAHWATYLYHRDQSPTNLFITSNVIVVLVWIAYLWLSMSIALIVQIVAFIYLLIIDHRLHRIDLITNHYFVTRAIPTVVAVLSLAILILLDA